MLSLTVIPNALSTRDLGFDGFAAAAIVSEPLFRFSKL